MAEKVGLGLFSKPDSIPITGTRTYSDSSAVFGDAGSFDGNKQLDLLINQFNVFEPPSTIQPTTSPSDNLKRYAKIAGIPEEKINTSSPEQLQRMVPDYINYKMNKQADLRYNPSDGKIGDFQQSNRVGDCRLLARVKSMSLTKTGSKMIEESIKPDGKGGYNVTFKGCPDKSFNVTNDDLLNPDKPVVYGDTDVAIIEAATRKYAKDVLKVDKDDPINGTEKIDIEKLLSGKDDTIINGRNTDIHEITNRMKADPERYSVGIGFDENNDKFGVKKGHAYAMDYDVKNKQIALINPWDTKKEIKIPVDKVEEIGYVGSYIDLYN